MGRPLRFLSSLLPFLFATAVPVVPGFAHAALRAPHGAIVGTTELASGWSLVSADGVSDAGR